MKGPMTELKRRGSRRSSESEEAILTAILQLLKEKPLRDITVEAIARKAGVGKMTIYKWWPSKAYVALDAMREKMSKMVLIPDTGDGERDIRELLHSAVSFYSSSTGRVFGQFLGESQSDPEFAALFRERVLDARREAFRNLLDRAMKRGEIDHTLDRDVIIDMIFGPMFYRLMTGYGRLNNAEADGMISTLFRGIGSSTRKAKRVPGRKLS